MAMRAKCRRLKAERPIGMVIIDYLQLIKWHRRVDNRHQEISEIARSLKSLARELNVPVIALSQLSRAAEKRDDHRPMLTDLRESGSIEAEADLVALLFRPAYYERKAEIDADKMSQRPDPYDVEEAEVIVAKHRNGPVGTVNVGFQPQYARFVNLERNLEE
jgi:replicative DNA helicase